MPMQFGSDFLQQYGDRVKFDVILPAEMASVLTTESVEQMELKIGDQVALVIKAVHVLPVKDA